MIKRGVIGRFFSLWLGGLFLVLACNSLPALKESSVEDETPVESGSAGGAAGGELKESSESSEPGGREELKEPDKSDESELSAGEEESPSVFFPPERASPELSLKEPAVPVIDIPEIDDPKNPPAERTFSVSLPEPPVLVVKVPAETVTKIAREEVREEPALTGGREKPAEQDKSKEPVIPPSFLRPSEPEIPVKAREPASRPVNPIAELPARELPGPGETKDELVFSRVVRATAGQLVEIPFRGTGWVYLGELGSRQGIVYDSRRLDPEGQSFVFRTEAAGTYVLKFYKQDFIKDYILNDHVQVIVGEAPESSGMGWFAPPVDRSRITASPRWPLIPGEGESRGSGAATAGTGAAGPTGSGATVAGTGVAGPTGSGAAAAGTGAAGPTGSGTAEGASQSFRPPITDEGIVPVRPPMGVTLGGGEASPARLLPDTAPDVYIRRAREEYDAGRVASALSVMDQFRERFPSGSDEGWWLYGQLLEANSPSRDIRTALDYYRRLVREYPQSPRYTDARRRIAYLERYFFNIQ
jgi:hypothetical protein